MQSPDNSSGMSHNIGLNGHFLFLPRDNHVEGKDAYSEDLHNDDHLDTMLSRLR